MNDLTIRSETQIDHAQALRDWYWESGINRSPTTAMSTNWLATLYDSIRLAETADRTAKRQRGGMAVWGPSQTGKSTMLSEFIDDDNPKSVDSAINFDPANPFRFNNSRHGSDEVPSFNPYNRGLDASGCVTRFYMTDKVKHPGHPVQLHLGDHQNIIHALAAGYTLECDIGAGASEESVNWTQSEFKKVFGDFDKTHAQDREGFELGLDLSLTIERLLQDQNDRYANLARVWNPTDLDGSGLKMDLLASTRTVGDANRITEALLWDSRSGMTDLYERLKDVRNEYLGKFGHRPVYCSLEVSAILVDIASYVTALGSSDGAHALRDKIQSLRYTIKKDHVLIDDTEGGLPLFPSLESFGLFQGLIWQLDVPLRAKFIRKKHPEIAKFLETSDVFDIPGVSRQDAATEEKKLRPDTGEASLADLLTRVVKQGKTASIITRYAIERQFDSVLLLLRSSVTVTKPQQIGSGLKAILEGTERKANMPGRQNNIPTYICLTFTAKILNDSPKGLGAKGLSTMDELYSRLGHVATPERSQFFATNYPHLEPDGLILDHIDTDALWPEIQNDHWFQRTFTTDAGQESFRRSMDKNDGGVAFMLKSIASQRKAGALDSFVEQSLVSLENTLAMLTREALPALDGDTEQTKIALEQLSSSVTSKLLRMGRTEITELAIKIASVFSLTPSDMLPLPRTPRNEEVMSEYIERSLTTWEKAPKRIERLKSLGLTDRQTRQILRAFRQQVPVQDVTKWVSRVLGEHISPKESDHFRGYLGERVTAHLKGPKKSRQNDGRSNTDRLNEYQDRLDRWTTFQSHKDSPHFSMIIKPFSNRVKALQSSLPGSQWLPQLGDAEVSEIGARFLNTTPELDEAAE